MKRSQLALAAAILPLDYLMLVFAGLLAYQLRFRTFVVGIRPIQFDLPVAEFLPTLLGMGIVWLVLFAMVGLYSMQSKLKLSQEIGRVFVGCTSGLALIVLLFFFNPNLFGSRFIVLVGWVMSVVLVSLERVIVRFVQAYLHRRGFATSRALLIGGGENADLLEKLFNSHPALGVRIAKRATVSLTPDFSSLIYDVDEVIIGEPTTPREFALKVLEYCQTHHLGFRYVADLFDANVRNVSIQTLAGVPLIEIKRTPLDGWGRIVKRIFDIIGSFCALVILSPFLLIVFFINIWQHGWPAVIKLERVGEGGKLFGLYKFRSMIVNAHELKLKLMEYNERSDGPLFKMANDPRITKFGKFLRRTSIDELPQLWNVLTGTMSLVGPRPHEPREVEHYQVAHHRLLNIKPGITGLAQVSGRSNLTFEEEAKLDTFYVENWSLGQDIVILLKTLVVVVQNSNAV